MRFDRNVGKDTYARKPESYEPTEKVRDRDYVGGNQVPPTVAANNQLVNDPRAIRNTEDVRVRRDPVIEFDTPPVVQNVPNGQNIPNVQSDRFPKTVSIYAVDPKVFKTPSPVVGWLVCTEGPNKGMDFSIRAGHNYLGREEGDIVIHGDDAISRKNQLRISYFSESRQFVIATLEGVNPDYLNNAALVEPKPLKSFDTIKIGRSEFLFIALCGERFSWW